jgi:tripartite-type tricarboxylate transporter receptor subunit TctC
MLSRVKVPAALILICIFMFAAVDARAQSVVDFYRGKQITLVTSASVGGGYDQYARLLAKHMPRHIPGSPAIVVENMVGAEGLHTIDDLKTREITVSSTAANSPTTIYSRILNATLGTKLKPVTGYAGSQACLLAVERGEVDAHISGGSSAPFRAHVRPWLQKGLARIIMAMGMKRDAEFPDAPTAIEAVHTAADKQMFEIAFAEQVMGRPFVLPPGTPLDRVAALRAAFDATMRDPDFLANANAQNAHVDPVGGQAINALLDRVYSAPPDVVARLRQLIK